MANNTIKILLIDDDIDLKEMVSEYINNKEHDLEFVIDQMCEFDSNKINYSYDIYLVDDMFRGISMSIEITKEIRSKHADSKIFILSGKAKERTLKNLINLKVDGFIEKDNLDVSPIIKSAKSIRLLRDQMNRLDLKISKLLSM